MNPMRSFGPLFLKSYVTTGTASILARMSGTSIGAMFSLNVRDEEEVNEVDPGLMPEVGTVQPEPEPIMKVNVGALQPMPTLPPERMRMCSVVVPPVVPVKKS